MLSLHIRSGTLFLVILGSTKRCDWRHRRRSMVGVWFPFFMHVFICAHDPFPFLSSANYYCCSVRYREILRRDTISRYQLSKFGIWKLYRVYRISWYRMILDTWYNITTSCDITPDHPETTGNRTRNLAAVFCFFWPSVFALFLACLSSVPPFLPSFFCCPSAGQIIDRTDRTTSKPKQ